MAKTTRDFGAKPGDTIVIDEHRVGETRRTGEILEALGEQGREHYRVRWQDGRESVIYPGSDATIRPATARR